MLLFLVGAALWLQDTVADPGPPGSQAGEAHVDGTIADPRNESPGDTRSQPQPVPTPNSSDTDAAVAKVSHRFNELRSEWLDHREKTVDWWLTATSVFLGLLAFFAVVAGYLGLNRLRQIEREAGKYAKSSKEHADNARDLVNEIQVQGDKVKSILSRITAETVHKNPDEVRKAAERIQGSPKASEIDRAIATAIELQQRKSFEKSIEQWHALAVILEEIDKDSAARAWFSVGYLSEEHTKDLDAAIDAYSKAVRLKPDLAEAYNNRGNAKDEVGRYEEAIADHDKAIWLISDYAEAYSNRGVAKRNLGRHEEAIADHDKAILLKPDFAAAYSNRGAAKNDLGRHEEAIADHDKAIRLKPDLAQAYTNRGIAKNDLGRHEEAIADHDKAILLKPNLAQAYNNRGVSKNDLGRHEEAIADHNAAIRLKRDFAEAYSNRGNAKDDLGRHAESVDDHDEAIRLKPDFAAAYSNRGVAKNKLGRYEEAIEDHDKAIRLKSDFAEAYSNRCLAKKNLGRHEEAIADCETAIDLARNSGNEALASVAQQVLKALTDEQNR